jgi:hypothetical protein
MVSFLEFRRYSLESSWSLLPECRRCWDAPARPTPVHEEPTIDVSSGPGPVAANRFALNAGAIVCFSTCIRPRPPCEYAINSD